MVVIYFFIISNSNDCTFVLLRVSRIWWAFYRSRSLAPIEASHCKAHHLPLQTPQATRGTILPLAFQKTLIKDRETVLQEEGEDQVGRPRWLLFPQSPHDRRAHERLLTRRFLLSLDDVSATLLTPSRSRGPLAQHLRQLRPAGTTEGRWLVQVLGCWCRSTGSGTPLRTWPEWWSGSGWTNMDAGGRTARLCAITLRTCWRGTPGGRWCWDRWTPNSPRTSSTCSPCTSSDRTQVRTPACQQWFRGNWKSRYSLTVILFF